MLLVSFFFLFILNIFFCKSLLNWFGLIDVGMKTYRLDSHRVKML